MKVPSASKAKIPALVQSLDSSNPQESDDAVKKMVTSGKEAVPILIHILTVRSGVAAVLSVIGNGSTSQLVAALSDPNRATRLGATSMIVKLGLDNQTSMAVVSNLSIPLINLSPHIS